ncbi:TPA: 1-deoxy-D-xylulose-5-phosphate reductoisomerase [bacterium]|nr:1-deoxy-D-xylulose-5-phosphate reductoisomerase [bacterium]
MNISILGSTGSIGISSLEVIEALGFKLIGITGGENVEKLVEQAKRFHPKIVAIRNQEKLPELKEKLKDIDCEVIGGTDGIIGVSTAQRVDKVIVAISGSNSLIPTLSAIKSGKGICLASKEAMVMAGEILKNEAKERNCSIIPVDSEHSAIFQCLQGQNKPKRIILTASGGPFLNRENMDGISPEEALFHPTWPMGKRITVDSATLMNKALEIIEASFLFDIPVDYIDVVIHPESIVHSMVEFSDGSVLAQMSHPDMKLAIEYSLTYPNRGKRLIKQLDFKEIEKLSFFTPDHDRFPSIKLGYIAAEKGGTMPAVLNAADEVAVSYFLQGKLKFKEIFNVVKKIMDDHKVKESPDIDDILSADAWAREEARCLLNF